VLNPECGDASACLNLRIPVIRRDRRRLFQRACHPEYGGFSKRMRQNAENSVDRPLALISVGDV
jgi:hypothetical protein